ncbi:MAG: DNA polymerase III subunit alpha, partial [Coriobacteriales bacterium]|nr:DNA polymerase III subunit alpha [Coriobacteriales bacterium]
MAFVHLHNHTEYSLLDGATKVGDMAHQAKEFGMDAVAITDHGYMYGVPSFVEACNKEGVKPIIGCEIYFTPDDELKRDKKPELYHMILLAKNLEGYHNLVKLVSTSATSNFYYKPRTNFELLQQHASGLIGTSACVAGIIPQHLMRLQEDDARKWAERLASVFAPGDFYIELQDQGLVFGPDELNKSVDLGDQGIQITQSLTQHDLNIRLDALAKSMGLGTVAANDMHYLRREDAATLDMMLCIGMGKKVEDPDRMRFSNDQFYMKSEAEMRQALKGFEDACDNTVDIAAKCNVELENHIILPVVPLDKDDIDKDCLSEAARATVKHVHDDNPNNLVPEELAQNINECYALYKEAIAGLERKYGTPLPQEVIDRFEYEYDVICTKGFPAYFLCVQEFVRWAKTHGVGVGPGRGSAAGSIVTYALDITTLEPLENGLMFERFLSPERTEMPDIDVDFDEEGRFKVIDHLRDVYGADHVAHVITYGTLKAKQAVVDAARIFDYPIWKGQEISKLIHGGPKASLTASLGINSDAEKNKELADPDLINAYKEDPDKKRILDSALRLEGNLRGEGIHASAVIICRDPVEDHVPTKLDTKGGVIITQYDGEHNAALGLLKMDFLGLRTLNVIMRAREYIKTNHGIDIDTENIPRDDPKAFEMMRRGDTAGMFQVESGGMTSLARRMQVDSFADIVAMIALFRPGPINSGFLEDFVQRRTGKAKVVYYDDSLKDILEETFGTIVYQEQVMRISMKMCGFTAGESDRVRKAVAKKKKALMTEKVQSWSDGNGGTIDETMYDHWINGAVKNGYKKELAQKIWDDVLAFAEYAFNKSHSAAYAIIVMQTAYLKSHYPVEYMAAVLSSFLGKNDKLTHYIAATKADGIEVLPPDVNSSGREFTPLLDGTIRFGLAGIKGVGEQAADAIIEEREANGRFTSLHDFVFRVPTAMCNKGTVTALVKAGAFDSTGYTRRQMMKFIDEDNLMDVAAKRQSTQADGQISLLDMFADSGVESGFEDDIPEPDGVEWERRMKLAFEKEILGMYVSDHPLAPYASVLARETDYPLSAFMENNNDDAASGSAGDEDDGEGSLDEADEDFEDRVVQRRPPQNRPINVAGICTNLKPMITKKGDRMAKFMLEDEGGSIEV